MLPLLPLLPLPQPPQPQPGQGKKNFNTNILKKNIVTWKKFSFIKNFQHLVRLLRPREQISHKHPSIEGC